MTHNTNGRAGLTDLEISKRIAEIEGIVNPACDGWDIYANVGDDDLPIWEGYRPLTDDGLCFQLMVKYKVRMHWLWAENDGTPHYEAYINEDSSDIAYDIRPNKAILLAIIAANGGKV